MLRTIIHATSQTNRWHKHWLFKTLFYSESLRAFQF